MDVREQRKAGEPLKETWDTTEIFGSPSFVISRAEFVTSPQGVKLYIEEIFIGHWHKCPWCKKEAVPIREYHFKNTDTLCLETLNCCRKFLWTQLPDNDPAA